MLTPRTNILKGLLRHIYIEKGQIKCFIFSFFGLGLKVTYNLDFFEKFRPPPSVFNSPNLKFRLICFIFDPPPPPLFWKKSKIFPFFFIIMPPLNMSVNCWSKVIWFKSFLLGFFSQNPPPSKGLVSFARTPLIKKYFCKNKSISFYCNYN